VLVSCLYLMVGRVMALVLLCFRSSDFKELEIVVLRHEPAVLRRQVSRPRCGPPIERCWPRRAGCSRGSGGALLVPPETLLAWHRRLGARRWTYPGRRPARPKLGREAHELVLRLARENPRWGYQRIAGQIGVRISPTTVRRILVRRASGRLGRGTGVPGGSSSAAKRRA
jgi:putative transposase